MIRFTQILDRLNYPRKYASVLSQYHAAIIDYVLNNFLDSTGFKRTVINAMNSMSYTIISDDSIPLDWKPEDPLINIPDIDDSLLESTLSKVGLYLNFKDIEWDIQPVIRESSMYVMSSSNKNGEKASNVTTHSEIKASNNIHGGDLIDIEPVKKSSKLILGDETPKEDLYLQWPVVPRFDSNQIVYSGYDGGDYLVIYKSLPEVPTRQREISVTTDITKYTESDLMKLYPKQFIKTRNPVMYEHVDHLDFHEELGVILPIEGYTREQLIDNLVKYPHFYQLKKYIDGNYVNFYSTIEIDGELHRIVDVWDTLEDTKYIPKTVEFMKEYVVRRYLLERDISGIEHKYSVWGTLEPFLTLFTTSDNYIRLGYTDVVGMARQCVLSRVSYRRFRNPVLRRLGIV